MASEEILTDEYVAELIDKEAKRSIKYSGMGFEGLTTSRYVPTNRQHGVFLIDLGLQQINRSQIHAF